MPITGATAPVDRCHCGCPSRARVASACITILLLGAGTLAHAQGVWRITPTISGAVTWTNNVDLAPEGQRESDWVFTVSPAVAIDYRAARAWLRGSVSAPIVLYAGTGDGNDSIYPNVNLAGNVELVEDLFFVDAFATVSQTYYSPFGARPPGLINATDNRYTSQTYQVSPYLKGNIMGGDTSWLIRNDNIWTNLNDTPETTQGQYVNHLFGTINRTPRPFGWGADIERTVYRFQGQDPQTIALARARGTWRPDPQLELYVSAGYEKDELLLTGTGDVIYGAGFRWRPTDRSRFDASWEHRFFGNSYEVLFENRRPLSVWSVGAYRRLTSYTESINLPQGPSVPGVLEQILQSRIPNAEDRARFVADYVANRGLPEFLDRPVNIYAQRLYVVQGAFATAGLTGARNSLFLNAYNYKQTPITGTGQEIPPEIGRTNNSTQTGVGAAWSYQLTPFTSFTLSGDTSWTKAEPPLEDRSDQQTVRAVVTSSVGPRTTTFFGASWQQFNSNVDSDYRETSVFAGFTHSFR